MKTWREICAFPPAVRLLLVNQLGVNTGFYLLIPYLAVHLSDGLGMSAAVVGTVLGVRSLSQQGLFVIGGSAADRLGARGVIIAGCGLRTAGFALFALGDGIAVLLAASVLSGLAGALFNPAVRSYLAQEAGERRAEAFALFNVFATTGALIGPLLGSVLLLVDFRAAALTAAGIFAVLTVAQALVLPPRRAAPATSGVLADWREVVRNRPFMAFACALAGMVALESQLYLLFPDGARRATGWDGAAGLVFLVGTLAGLAFQLRITRALKRRGSRATWIATGLLLTAAAFVPPVLVTSGAPPDTDTSQAVLRAIPVLAGSLLLQTGLMVAQPFVMELIPAFGRPGLTGTYFGVFYVVSGIAAALGNAAVGWAMDTGQRIGAGWLPWACCLVLGLVSAAGTLRLHRRGTLPGRPVPVPVHA
ncbi:MFS transporter [Streptomyces sp. NBC_01257]|uniref:MFS transporter n=1 Tax=Streptomyces sp. NBC_01257 TaxID=2903799 RepID=UPI002DDC61DB|nr:MFS transporter [Streptomyces sp. NBC_01257]WRZ69343.1 MFS transporter [Streptomyces sp. NBC_01257]